MDANGQSDIMGDLAGGGEESVIEHNGKKYTRI
jgi:hemin uptake protein HemP